MKKILSLFVMVFLLLNIVIVSADKTEFLENEGYGVYELWDTFLTFKTNKIATYELEYNTDYCPQKCRAMGTVEVFEKTQIFDKIKYETMNGHETVLQKSDNYYSLPPTIEIINKPTYTQSCEIVNHANGSVENVCENHYNGTVQRENIVYDWQKLGQKQLDPGNYSWKIEGEITKTVDWIIVNKDLEFTEWAVWNNSFTEKMVAYFSFDTGDELIDIGTGRHNMTVGGGSAAGGNTSIAKIGESLFCGESGYTNVFQTALLNLGDTGAISFWLYRTATDNRWSNVFYGFLDGSNFILMSTNGAAANTDGVTADGQSTSPNAPVIGNGVWYHIVANWNPTTLQFYIDGSLYATAGGTFDVDINAMSYFRVCSSGGNNEWLQGNVDEFAIFNDTLAIGEILALNDSAFFRPGGILLVQNEPSNNTINFSGNNIRFNVTIESVSSNVANSSLFINDTLIETAIYSGTNPVEDAIYNITFTGIGDYTWFVQAYSVGGIQGNSSEFVFTIANYRLNSETYSATTNEGNLEEFIVNVTTFGGLTVSSANFFYNNQTEVGQVFTVGSDTIMRVQNFTVPTVSGVQNFTFNWTLSLSNGSTIKTPNHNQTVSDIGLDNCSTFTTKLYNFTLVDEEFQFLLSNTTIDVAFNIFDSAGTTTISSFSQQFNDTNPIEICLSTTLSNSSSFLLDGLIKYQANGYAIEYYNIVGSILNSDTIEQNITLYDLNITDSTDFQLTFTGSDFLPVENALVYVNRQYVNEDVFKTVEIPKTDYNGQSVLHLVRNDVIYNVIIIKDGVVLGNFENLVAFCDDFTIGDCNIELNAFDSVESVFNYNEDLGIIFTTPEYNSTSDIISFNFLTSDGSVKTVRLEVEKNDIFGNRSICNSSLTSSGGSLFCNVASGSDESTLKVYIYTDDVLTFAGSVELDSSGYGVGGYLIMFVFTISMVLMFSGSKTGVLASLGLSLAGSIGMGISSGNMIGLGASGLWLLVMIIAGIYKLNKGRQS